MKLVAIAFFFSFSIGLNAQSNPIGNYRDNFGNRIQLNKDHTFTLTWSFDLAASWTKGIWAVKKDTVFFEMVVTYDTLSQTKTGNITTDTLILSDDDIPERITPTQSVMASLSSGGQNRKASPDKLLMKKGRLYKIRNGSLVTEKQKGFGTSKMLEPYFIIEE